MKANRISIPLLLFTLLVVVGFSGAQSAAQDATAVPVDDYTEIPPAAAPVPTPRSSESPSATAPVERADRGKASAKRLATGYADLLYQGGDAQSTAAFDETVATHAGVVRLAANWASIAPANPGPTFDATNPASPGYNFSGLDTAIRKAAARGLHVIILVSEAPAWAEGAGRPATAAPGTWKPNPADVADFGTALAKRYSGSFLGLPRVQDFQLWAEPNLESNLTPIWTGKNGKKPAAPVQYRLMLNAFYDAVHAVNNSNNVVTGGTAPYGADPGVLNMRPLQFWREVMCVKDDKRLSPVKNCKKAKFDVLAHHPINTSGGPTTSAISDDDVSTPDLHNLVDVLRSAERAGNVIPNGSHPVWATELWWESDPPDPYGNNPSVAIQAKWYQQSLYLLWKQGASMVLLLQVRDAPFDGDPGRFNGNFQTGVYFVDGKPKPAAQAMSFPFVLDRKSKNKVRIWGIAPATGTVEIQRQKGNKVQTVKRLNGKAGQIFKSNLRDSEGGKKLALRAKVGSARSLVYKIK